MPDILDLPPLRKGSRTAGVMVRAVAEAGQPGRGSSGLRLGVQVGGEVDTVAELMTVKEVAKALGVSTRTIARLVAQQRIEVIRPAGLDLTRFRRTEIERLIAEGCIPPARYWSENRRGQLRRA